jgi:hypothetical protein
LIQRAELGFERGFAADRAIERYVDRRRGIVGVYIVALSFIPF